MSLLQQAIAARCLVELYSPFDKEFLNQWNGNYATYSIE